MKLIVVLLSCLYLWSCQQVEKNTTGSEEQNVPVCNPPEPKSYEQIKTEIAAARNRFAVKPFILNDSFINRISDFWVNAIGNDLYSKWQNTPWDFNGITTKPQQGFIACGYFVTTLLRDMDLSINRIKLSTCASSQMMKSLAPGQPLKNLSCLDYQSFNDKLKDLGKGVYIIGLDFHTGFIVNDGTENWFIHSNYIGRKGVVKESVMNSDALKASKTRWLISLTADKAFIQKWLRSN